MINRTSFLLASAAAAAFALAMYVGCSKQAPAPTAPAHDEHEGHTAEEHAAMDHHDAEHEEHAADAHQDEHHDADHHSAALKPDDVKMPESFAAGVAQLTELHQKINQLIEHNELADVHRAAEEMAIVARKMKELASKDIAEDSRTEAGRLCNEIASYFNPIDEAADAGKKDETIAIHHQMADTIAKLAALSKK